VVGAAGIVAGVLDLLDPDERLPRRSTLHKRDIAFPDYPSRAHVPSDTKPRTNGGSPAADV
jgi:hypothetical protein